MTASEYSFPIFISSTEYNLVDLRAELAQFLSQIGYKPVLSSAEGFPDNGPGLKPWESCLPVLQTCFVVILIIDGRYGTPLSWPGFEDIITKEVSPTHGEYLFALHQKKRMLVFVRDDVMTHYQSYRAVVKNSKGTKAAEKNFRNALPKQYEFRTMEFIHEVKNQNSIPWVKTFKNVTDIKTEVQKKLLNALAEQYLFKQKHLESVIRAFTGALDDLSPDKRQEILAQVTHLKPIIDQMNVNSRENGELRKKAAKADAKVLELQAELRSYSKQADRSKIEGELVSMVNERLELYGKIANNVKQNTNILLESGVFGFTDKPVSITGLNEISTTPPNKIADLGDSLQLNIQRLVHPLKPVITLGDKKKLGDDQ